MNRYIITIIMISLSYQLPLLAGEVKVKPGETLSILSKKYNVPIELIIDSNDINNPDNLRVGQKIIIPNKIDSLNEIKTKNYTIKKGDTIDSISNLFNISKEDILRINKIQTPNLIFEGQSILIPVTPSFNQSVNPSYHVLLEGETLYKISKKYNLPLEIIMKINNTKNLHNLKPGSKIYLKETTPDQPIKLSSKKNEPEWREYGSLKINWSTWQKIEDNLIALSLNKKGKPLYLAVNCYSSQLNWRTIKGKWNEWFVPKYDSEFDLLDDLCMNTLEL